MMGETTSVGPGFDLLRLAPVSALFLSPLFPYVIQRALFILYVERALFGWGLFAPEGVESKQIVKALTYAIDPGHAALTSSALMDSDKNRLMLLLGNYASANDKTTTIALPFDRTARVTDLRQGNDLQTRNNKVDVTVRGGDVVLLRAENGAPWRLWQPPSLSVSLQPNGVTALLEERAPTGVPGAAGSALVDD